MTGKVTYTIACWMPKNLKLKGNELMVYAAIHGFSQDGKSHFKGGLKYIAEITGSSVPTVIKTINELIKKNLICKSVYPGKENISNEYWVNMEMVNKTLTKKPYKRTNKNKNLSTKETLQDGTKEIIVPYLNNNSTGTKETLPYINTYNNTHNNDDDKEKKKPNIYSSPTTGLILLKDLFNQIGNDDIFIEEIMIKVKQESRRILTPIEIRSMFKVIYKDWKYVLGLEYVNRTDKRKHVFDLICKDMRNDKKLLGKIKAQNLV